MQLLSKYLIYSSVFALFTEDFFYRFGIDVKLYYLIIGVNLILYAYYFKIVVHKNLLLVLSFFLIHGMIGYFFLSNPIKSLFAQLVGISLSSIYYYNFIKEFSVKKVFKVYLDLAFIVAIIAIPMYFFEINSFSKFRLNGILTEPAHYAAIMLPAVYSFLRNKNFYKLTVLVITIFLSKSSIGYIGLALIILIPLIKMRFFMKYAWITLFILGGSAYFLSTQWHKPVDENQSNVLLLRLKETARSLNALSTGELEENTNLSSYAFLSNSFVTNKIIRNYPLGTGLGSYQYVYEKYYPLLKPPPYLIQLKQSKINKTDANSLMLRILSDFGVFAVFILLFFILRSVKLFRMNGKIIQQSTFFYLIVKLIREGHYFPPEFYFFLLIFLKNDFDENLAHS